MTEKYLEELKKYDGKEIRLMEVCGSHTAAIARSGIKDLISPKIRLISGPGCPVCVTVSDYIDRLIELALEGKTIVTFGDMMRVPGGEGSLYEAKGKGAGVEMVYSPLDLLDMASAHPEKDFIFAAVGFETTIPVYTLLLDEVRERGLKNVRILSAMKCMVPVIEHLLSEGCDIDGFIAPGHVSVITGENAYKRTAEKFGVPFAVTGFSERDIITGIFGLVRMINEGEGTVKNFYPEVVTPEGNSRAKEKMEEYFEPGAASWRGMGSIPGSGLYLKKKYAEYDAGSRELDSDKKADERCCCGKVLTGKIQPSQCPLFSKECDPLFPKGACMVSSEGSCFIEYKRGGS